MLLLGRRRRLLSLRPPLLLGLRLAWVLALGSGPRLCLGRLLL